MAMVDQTASFEDEPPWSEHLTDYDRSHLQLYVRLLDACAAKASLADIANHIFGVNANADPERAKRIVETHSARARWMTQYGFRDLLR
jgi:hypothetical protein